MHISKRHMHMYLFIAIKTVFIESISLMRQFMQLSLYRIL